MNQVDNRTPRKPRACVPCHERKVRCDSAHVGTPCTRCTEKDRGELCVLVALPTRKETSHRSSKRGRLLSARRRAPLAENDQSRRPSTDHASSGEDRQDTSSEGLQHIVVEYYKDLNALVLLNEALGQPKPRGLAQADPLGPSSLLAQEREISQLDTVDRAYLQQRGVHEFPPGNVREALIRVFFGHIYTYLPVLDRPQFMREYRKRKCSTFLLHALFAVAIPYASDDIVRAAGYPSVTAAQTDFFNKARILHDFGCERNDLNLLQGSVLLSSFQHHFEPTKDFRFWLSNAVRLATQMGFDRRDFGNDLKPAVHSLCRRIWWVMLQRDSFCCLAGHQERRWINGVESSTPLIDLEDFEEELPPDESPDTMPSPSHLQKQFFIESCRLAQLAAQYLSLFQTKEAPPPMHKARHLSKAIASWRTSLPTALQIAPGTIWSVSNIWIIVIHALSFHLEAVLYHTICKHQSAYGQDDRTAMNQRKLDAIFEWGTLLRRCMMHDIIQFAPPAFIDCTAQIMALEIKIALSPSCSVPQQVHLRTDIHAFLAYFEEIGNKWSIAKWHLKVFRLSLSRVEVLE